MEEIEKTNQKPEGSVAWHVLTVLVTNAVVGGSVNLLLTMLVIGIFSYNLSVTVAQVIEIVISLISVAVGISLAAAYLLTKYNITAEVAKKITLWTTGIVLLFNILPFLAGRSVFEIIAPLIYIASIYIMLSLSFDQNRNYLQSFSNQRIRLIEGLLVVVAIVAFALGTVWFSLSGNLTDYINRSPLVSEKERQDFNAFLNESIEKDNERLSVHGDTLKSELDMYYALYGKKYPESLDDADFQEKRLSNFFGGDSFLFDPNMNDFTYTATDDLQQFELCVKNSTTCWTGDPNI